MKKIITVLFMLLCASVNYAHNVDLTGLNQREWKLNNNSTVSGSLLMVKGNTVYIEKANGSIQHFPVGQLSSADADYVKHRYSKIQQLNSYTLATGNNNGWLVIKKMATIAALLTLVSLILYFFAGKRKLEYIAYFLAVGILASVYGFRKASFNQLNSLTSPSFVDSAFVPFKPNVATYYDNNYFYVESKGIPTTHEMMVGISNHGWQQQVPIPQCYFNPNSWSIPLNPVMAVTPIPCDSIHFTRGAIAIAVNGVPIFNVHTNTGVDSYLDGQLDDFGGHCGRADDYHYHIAPLHLYNYTSTSLPIAFGLDGYAVYGSVEPDGSAMQSLDANHGHFGTDGVYHYHGTTTAPYMIAQMAGQVTEDNTHQLIPQAAAHPIRPSRTPLTGALITSCLPNANNNGYTLTYTRSAQTYQVDYNWDAAGNYTFHYINPNGTLDSVYHGFVQCELPTGIHHLSDNKGTFTIFPNPTSRQFELVLDNRMNANDVKSTSIVSLNGNTVYTTNNFKQTIDIGGLPSGVYYVVVKTNNTSLVKKLLVQ